MVVQSGNYEFIGIRHRLSQTLYGSDIIRPHACREPSYGKIHIGIYVAAVLDDVDQAKQRATSGLDSGGPSGNSGDQKDDEKPGADSKKKSDNNPKGGGAR